MKSFCVLFIALYSIADIYAQISPDIEWQKSYGTTLYDEAFSFTLNNAGGYTVAGFNSGLTGDATCTHGGSDIWILGIDASGNLIWQNCLGGTSSEAATSIIQTTDNGYAIGGYTNSSDGDVSSHYGISFNSDYWVVKTDSIGNIEWENNLGGISNDVLTCLQQTFDGGYIVAGYTSSTGGDVTGNHGNIDCWIVKLNSSGEIEWQKALGGSFLDYAYSIIQSSDSNYVVCGQTWSEDGDITYNHGSGDLWVVKLNLSGEIIWQKCFGGGGGTENGQSIVETPEGDYMIAGYTNLDGGDVSGNHGDFDIWILKINMTGNLIWQKCLGGYDFELANSITNSINGYFICGYTTSNSGDVSDCHDCDIDHGDEWVIKTDTAGIIIWEKSLGGTNDDQAFAGMQTDGGFFIAGYSYSNDFDVTLNQGETDYWLVKLDCDTTATFYADIDGDGFGDFLDSVITCTIPPGYVYNHSDCNDSDPLISPSAFEFCNGLDDNCNGIIDDDPVFHVFYADEDEDNFGNILIDSSSCFDVVTGYVSDSTDCDDSNSTIYPGAPEIEDGLDNNCNDSIDEGLTSIDILHSDNYLNIFPNPADKIILIEINSSEILNENAEIEILNLFGETLFRIPFISNDKNYKFNLDISELTAGIYIIKLNSVNYPLMKKIVVI